MTEDKVVRIVGARAADAQKSIIALGDRYAGECVSIVEARIRGIIESADCEPSEFVPTIADRIVDGHRGQDIFAY